MKRTALCIGISNYISQGSLDHAAADAKLVASSLQQRSFHCIELYDPCSDDFDAALRELETQLCNEAEGENSDSCFTVIFFAGHGVEVGGGGYLMPSDFPDNVTPSALRHFSIPVGRLLEAISPCKGPKIIVLDACRTHLETSSAADKSILSDLLEEQSQLYSRAAKSHNVLIAYSTSAGDTASDGLHGNSEYSRWLAEMLLQYDSTVQEVFTAVAQKVIADSSAKQRPWHYSSLIGEITFFDLPELIPYLPTAFAYPPSDRARLSLHNDGLIYHAGRRVFLIRGIEARALFSVSSEIHASGSLGWSIIVATDKALVKVSDGVLTEIGQHGVSDPFGIIVSPSFKSFTVIGIDGFSVFQLNGEAWRCILPSEEGRGYYGGTYLDEQRVALTTDNGLIAIVDFSTGIKISTIELPKRRPCYAIKVLSHTQEIVTACAGGRLDYFDLQTLAWTATTDVQQPGFKSPHAYSALRDAGLSAVDAVEYLKSPDNISTYKEMTRAELLEYLASSLPARNPVCIEVTCDPRVLAVAFDDGFIQTVDIRSKKIFQMLDCGGSRGEKLNWMTLDTDGKLVALSARGTIASFELAMPRC